MVQGAVLLDVPHMLISLHGYHSAWLVMVVLQARSDNLQALLVITCCHDCLHDAPAASAPAAPAAIWLSMYII